MGKGQKKVYANLGCYLKNTHFSTGLQVRTKKLLVPEDISSNHTVNINLEEPHFKPEWTGIPWFEFQAITILCIAYLMVKAKLNPFAALSPHQGEKKQKETKLNATLLVNQLPSWASIIWHFINSLFHNNLEQIFQDEFPGSLTMIFHLVWDT